MFSPTKLQLEPSKTLALFSSIPFACSWLLIALADIRIPGSLALLTITTLCWWHFVRKYALLKSRHSALLLEHLDSNFFLTDASGKRMAAKPLASSIIHPWFTLVSFRCTAFAEFDALQLSESKNCVRYLQHRYHRFKQRLSTQPSRHIIICSYNVASLNEYRRLRVALKFS